MLRSLVKSAAAYAVSLTRLDKLTVANSYRRFPLILCYHRVVEQLNANRFALPSMEISVATLERHLDWLAKHFRIVSLDNLTQILDEPSGSKPMAAVTLDDGYSDSYHHAFPLLRRKGIPAALFVITALLGSTQPPIHERLHALMVANSRKRSSVSEAFRDVLRAARVELSWRAGEVTDPFSATRILMNQLPQSQVQSIIKCLEASTDLGETWSAGLQPLSWEMLKEMRDRGMTIASHTKTSPFLTNESEERVLDEVASSRRDLERRLGGEVRLFAYPGGFYNSMVVDAVVKAGYRYAFATCQHRDPRHPELTVPRTTLWEQSCLDPFGRFSTSIMSSQAAGTFNRFSKCTQIH